jgi:hypothetical protein
LFRGAPLAILCPVAEPDDRTFVALARKAGYPTEDRLRHCRAVQLDRAKRGERASLFATARREGALTTDQARRYERWADQIARRDPAPISEGKTDLDGAVPDEDTAPPSHAPALPAELARYARSPERVLYQSAAEFPAITPTCKGCGIDLDDLALMEGRARQSPAGILVCLGCEKPAPAKKPGLVRKLKESAVVAVGKVVGRKPMPVPVPAPAPAPPPSASAEAPRGLVSAEVPAPRPAALPVPSRGRIRKGTQRFVKAVSAGASVAIERVRGKKKKGDPPTAARTSRGLLGAILALTVLVMVGSLVVVVHILSQDPSKPHVGPTQPGTGPVASSAGTTPATEHPDANGAWSAVRSARGDDLPAALDAFAERFEGDPRARDAAWTADRLREARRSSSADTSLAAMRVIVEAERLEAEHKLARAKAVFELARSLDNPGGATASRAQEHLLGLAALARDEMAIARDRIDEARDHEGAAHALVLALDTRERLRGAGVDDQLAALVADLEQAASAARAVEARAPSADLHEPIDLTLKLDLDAARAKWSALLAKPLTLDERLRAEWSAGWCFGIERLFRALLDSVSAGKKPEITVRGALRGTIGKADAQKLAIDIAMGGGSATIERTWRQVEPGQVLDLLEPIARVDEAGALALAFYAFGTGHEDRGHGLLIGALARRPETAARVFSFLSVVTGSTLPEGGYVVFEGRLVAPAERDRAVLARKQAKEDAAAAARDLAKEQSKDRENGKLRRYLARAIALCDDGEYVEGRSILQALVTRFGDVPGIGDTAKARLDAPYLRRRALAPTGPSANRLDLYILGEGFLLDDDKQRAFDRLADGTKRLLERNDFYQEYASYLNYFAVNVASKEEGVAIGNGFKDTALGGRIADGELTLDNSRVLSLLAIGFPNENDQVAFGIANADAQIATGGGGVASLPRNFLQSAPHEFGHAFGKLGDEYELNPHAGAKGEGERPAGHVAPEVAAPNLVRGSDEAEVRGVVPWLHWFKLGDQNWTGRPIDVLEGGGTHRFNHWRAQRACVMRDVGSPYCAVCMEAMVKELYRRVRPIDQTWPGERGISHSVRTALTLRVALLAPRSHPIDTTWWIESKGDASGGTVAKGPKKRLKVTSRTRDGDRDVETVKIDGKELAGPVVVTVEAHDPTPWVQKDDEGLLRQTFQWTVEVE